MTKRTKKSAQKMAKKNRIAVAKITKSALRLKREHSRRHPAFNALHVARRSKSKPAPHAVPIAGGEWCSQCCKGEMQRYCRPDGWVPTSNAPFNTVALWERCSCGHIRIIARNDGRPIT